MTSAGGGREALALADSEPFDVILLDLMMPDLNGFEVLARLKADARTENIPVIMISAYDEQSKATQCIEIGAEDYLSKPFNAVLLAARINPALNANAPRNARPSISNNWAWKSKIRKTCCSTSCRRQLSNASTPAKN
ncbi:MAG: response regulator [Rhodospirillaceae bacterium]|nr:response regulator [Rhodospirillaceae bacterium]MBT3911506.1 response regulator [Rhodospirillaceae bacterium]MBT5300366.1 response regulator [Rhodospirillaceae bacterium]MBT7250303.1 response regulator [Rhodospirillaceae bacterium]MBT7509168.1 response regulator [Rhodospirillaceae bacterium]